MTQRISLPFSIYMWHPSPRLASRALCSGLYLLPVDTEHLLMNSPATEMDWFHPKRPGGLDPAQICHVWALSIAANLCGPVCVLKAHRYSTLPAGQEPITTNKVQEDK